MKFKWNDVAIMILIAAIIVMMIIVVKMKEEMKEDYIRREDCAIRREFVSYCVSTISTEGKPYIVCQQNLGDVQW